MSVMVWRFKSQGMLHHANWEMTDCGLDGLGSNPSGDEIFSPCRLALGSTQPPLKWVPGLSRG